MYVSVCNQVGVCTAERKESESDQRANKSFLPARMGHLATLARNPSISSAELTLTIAKGPNWGVLVMLEFAQGRGTFDPKKDLNRDQILVD